MSPVDSTAFRAVVLQPYSCFSRSLYHARKSPAVPIGNAQHEDSRPNAPGQMIQSNPLLAPVPLPPPAHQANNQPPSGFAVAWSRLALAQPAPLTRSRSSAKYALLLGDFRSSTPSISLSAQGPTHSDTAPASPNFRIRRAPPVFE
jgi:hypothetical protein